MSTLRNAIRPETAFLLVRLHGKEMAAESVLRLASADATVSATPEECA